MNKLILMMGIPGSGKSTFARNNLGENDVYVSRDEVRFELVREDEEYFSRETEVFNEFVRRIDEGLRHDKTVWADATHITTGSRKKLLVAIQEEIDELWIIWVKVGLQVALDRNSNRKGTRAFVPPEVVKRMYSQTNPPRYDEGFCWGYDTIFIVDDETDVAVKQERKEGK